MCKFLINLLLLSLVTISVSSCGLKLKDDSDSSKSTVELSTEYISEYGNDAFEE